MRKFKFISKSNKYMSIDNASGFEMSRHLSKKEVEKKVEKIRLSSAFVLALCGGVWPKSKDGACFDAVACWKIDLDRKTLVPHDGGEGEDTECPVPDLKLQMVVEEFH